MPRSPNRRPSHSPNPRLRKSSHWRAIRARRIPSKNRPGSPRKRPIRPCRGPRCIPKPALLWPSSSCINSRCIAISNASRRDRNGCADSRLGSCGLETPPPPPKLRPNPERARPLPPETPRAPCSNLPPIGPELPRPKSGPPRGPGPGGLSSPCGPGPLRAMPPPPIAPGRRIVPNPPPNPPRGPGRAASPVAG